VKIIERYIFKEALGYFLICLLAFTSVLLSVRILKFASLIINKGVDFSQVATVFLAIIPTFLEFAIPMATLLGITLAIARLSGDSEIIVLRASGISILQLIRPVVIFGAIITAFALYISVYLRPWGYQKLDDTLFEIAQTKTTAGLESGVFNQLGKIILYAEEVDSIEGNLKNVLLDDWRSEEERKIIVAKTGLISSNEETREILLILENGMIHEKTSEKYSVTKFQKNYLRLNAMELMGSNETEDKRKVRQISTSQLYDRITNGTGLPKFNNEEDRKRNINEAKMELARRFALPFAAFLLALLGLALGIQPPRLQKVWGASFSIALGLLIFAFYFGLMSLGSVFGEKSILPISLAAWLPNIIIFFVAAHFIRQVGLEKWQSVADALSIFLLKFRRS
jgi:lipopolysaccharide export system permease protein